jgi:hypothetical protein
MPGSSEIHLELPVIVVLLTITRNAQYAAGLFALKGLIYLTRKRVIKRAQKVLLRSFSCTFDLCIHRNL